MKKLITFFAGIFPILLSAQNMLSEIVVSNNFQFIIINHRIDNNRKILNKWNSNSLIISNLSKNQIKNILAKGNDFFCRCIMGSVSLLYPNYIAKIDSSGDVERLIFNIRSPSGQYCYVIANIENDATYRNIEWKLK